MKTGLVALNQFLDHSIGWLPRGILALAALLLVLTYLSPLWELSMYAPQYPDGLQMDIYSYKLEGGNKGQDIKEINVLNHYIGMKDIQVTDFTQFKWIPFVTGLLALLFLRAAVRGKVSDLVDVLVLYAYFGAFSLGSFAATLWDYGHHLASTAPVKIGTFMPPVFGFKQLANFKVYSYPQLGTYVFLLVVGCLACAFFFALRSFRKDLA